MNQIGYVFNIVFTFPIFNVLMLLDHIFGDFGLSIIVLTLLIRTCLFPLTLKQLRSSKATQAIQPLMADIKKKYPKDQRAQYDAMQALYKEYKINPVAGCLPLVVQLPILYGLYFAMRTVLTPSSGHLTLVYLNSIIYPFLWKFQALPSFNLSWFTFINKGLYISLANPDPTHILPVLAGLATFAQLRMSQPRAASTSGQKDMMSQQMQIMGFVMPFITFFFALNFPAGLALYWTTTSIFSMVQQFFVTGWGSLFILPPFLASLRPETPKTYVNNNAKEKITSSKIVESSAEVLTEPSSNTRTLSNNYSNGSTANRRRRPNSASARRRGTAPRRNPSRS